MESLPGALRIRLSGEVGGGMIGADSAFVVAEVRIHQPVKAVFDHPMAADSRPELGCDP
jgi:hypothetical protein